MNQQLLDEWIKVLEACVCRIDIKFVSEHVVNQIKDMGNLQNQLPKRKHGIKMIFAVAKSVGEKGIDKDPNLQNLISRVCQDNNLYIRQAGLEFMKEYLEQSREQILKSPRFKSFYLPTLFDFVDDEDLHIQLQAIEVMVLIMD
jgi:hypothetical protein